MGEIGGKKNEKERHKNHGITSCRHDKGGFERLEKTGEHDET